MKLKKVILVIILIAIILVGIIAGVVLGKERKVKQVIQKK